MGPIAWVREVPPREPGVAGRLVFPLRPHAGRETIQGVVQKGLQSGGALPLLEDLHPAVVRMAIQQAQTPVVQVWVRLGEHGGVEAGLGPIHRTVVSMRHCRVCPRSLELLDNGGRHAEIGAVHPTAKLEARALETNVHLHRQFGLVTVRAVPLQTALGGDAFDALGRRAPIGVEVADAVDLLRQPAHREQFRVQALNLSTLALKPLLSK